MRVLSMLLVSVMCCVLVPGGILMIERWPSVRAHAQKSCLQFIPTGSSQRASNINVESMSISTRYLEDAILCRAFGLKMTMKMI